MITRKDVYIVINEAEQSYEIAWNTLNVMKLAKPETFTIEVLLALQPAIAKGIYSLAKIYHGLAAEKRSYIRRKEKLNENWFKNRLRQISNLEKAIWTAISIGKCLGDAFAWFFYHNERELLLEHSKHQRIPIPPIGIGGKGELTIAEAIQVVDGHIFLHHGITNILRYGDVSIISASDMKIVAIAEIKSKQIEPKTLDIFMNLASVNEDKLRAFNGAMSRQISQNTHPVETFPVETFPKEVRERLDDQLKHIGKMLNRSKPDQNERVQSESHIDDIKKVFEDQSHVLAKVHKIGQSQVVIRADLSQKSLADRLLIGPNPAIVKNAQGLVEATIKIAVEDKSLNRIYVAEPYNPSPEFSTNSAMVPMIWWPIDLQIPKALIFHKTILFSIFNTGPFLLEIQKLGFEIIVNGHSYSARKQFGENIMYLGNLQSYFDLIVFGFMPEKSLIEIISIVVRSYEDGKVPIDTQINLAIQQHIFG